jgi:circadian clock protein KaiB
MSHLVMRLYVAGDGPNSVAARNNLQRLLAQYDSSTHTLEIVDCMQEPLRALHEGVLVTPTLVRLEPEPTQTIIGSLSDTERVLGALGLPALETSVGGVR